MQSIQATIIVERGRISSIKPHPNGVEIISEQGIHFYPDAWILPGLVDSHCHIHGLGTTLTGLSLYAALSAEECIALALEHADTCGTWILGNGWNQELWANPIYPSKDLLDIVFPDRPVYLRRADGHAAWVNSKAMELAGIYAGSSVPNGGAILTTDDIPNGILIDNAMNLVAKCIPALSPQEIKTNILKAVNLCSSMGLTEVHDMDVHPDFLPYYLEMAENGTLPIRIQSYVSAQNDEWLKHGCLPAVGEFMRIVGLKFFADGALGSRGAALLEQYSDSDTCGLMLMQKQELYDKAAKGLDYGWYICTHAIGDAANRMVIDVYERLRSEGKASKDDILRIEHAQIVHPNDIERIAANSIKAAVQPIHCISDAMMAQYRLSARTTYAYPWKTLIDKGIHIAGGSDFPIESGNPFIGISAYCHRIPFNSTESWYGNECIEREQALLSYTKWAHEASGMEYRRGALQPRFDADFTVVDRNILTCEAEDIATTNVLSTYTAGIRRYSREH